MDLESEYPFNVFQCAMHLPLGFGAFVAGGPFESVDWMFSRRSFYGGDVGSFDCLIRFMTGKPMKL